MKLFATDYDGTLKVDGTIQEKDLLSIYQWKAKGNLFVIDTDRSMESILEQVQLYKLPVDYFVTNNGGMAFDASQKEIFSTYLDPVMAIDIMYIAKMVGGIVSYVVNDGFYRHRIIVDDQLEEKRYPNLAPDITEAQLHAQGKYAQIVLSMASKEQALQLEKRINDHFADQIVAYANQYVVDVVPKNISKATGIARICAQHHIDKNNIYTIGDGNNDIPLITFSPHGAAVDWASEEVKNQASQVVGSIAELLGGE